MLLLFLLMNNAIASDFTPNQLKVIKDLRWAATIVEVPSDILIAICFQESNLGAAPHMTHMDGMTLSYGICQMKLATARYMDEVFKHKKFATAKGLEDPKINSFYAAKFLRYQLRRHGWRLKLAVDAYNKHNALGENTKYVKDVWKKLEILHERLPTLQDSR